MGYGITVMILTFVLWILSHKYFRFIYFGNIGNAIIKELIECLFISIILVSIFGAFGGAILGLLGTVLKWVLIAAAIIAVIFLIKKAVSGKN